MKAKILIKIRPFSHLFANYCVNFFLIHSSPCTLPGIEGMKVNIRMFITTLGHTPEVYEWPSWRHDNDVRTIDPNSRSDVLIVAPRLLATTTDGSPDVSPNGEATAMYVDV